MGNCFGVLGLLLSAGESSDLVRRRAAVEEQRLSFFVRVAMLGELLTIIAADWYVSNRESRSIVGDLEILRFPPTVAWHSSS